MPEARAEPTRLTAGAAGKACGNAETEKIDADAKSKALMIIFFIFQSQKLDKRTNKIINDD